MKRFLMLLAMLLFSGFALAAININTATVQELEALNGVGPVKAQAIVDYRKANGPFKSVEQIKDVKGIGDATFDKIKGDISVSGKTTAPAAAAREEPAKAVPPVRPAPGPATPSPGPATPAAMPQAPKGAAPAPAPAAPMKAAPAKEVCRTPSPGPAQPP